MVAGDAVPIVILQPFGPIQFVYDVGDTHGPPLPARMVCEPVTKGSVPRDAWDKTVSAASKCGVAIEVVDNYGAALAGTAAILDRTELGSLLLTGETVDIRFRIKLNGRLDNRGRFAVLAHELGHIYCRHQGGDRDGRWPDRRDQLTKGQRELEAEAVSWLVCSRLGLETRSAEYLSQYVGEGDLEKISTFAITAAAHRVEAWRHYH